MLYILGYGTIVLLNSGNTFNYLNRGVFGQIVADLDATTNSSLPYPLADCTKRDMVGAIIFGFETNTISVSFADFIFLGRWAVRKGTHWPVRTARSKFRAHRSAIRRCHFTVLPGGSLDVLVISTLRVDSQNFTSSVTTFQALYD
jgi:hypothetical protein